MGFFLFGFGVLAGIVLMLAMTMNAPPPPPVVSYVERLVAVTPTPCAGLVVFRNADVELRHCGGQVYSKVER